MSDFHFEPEDKAPKKPLDPQPARAAWDFSEAIGQVETLLDQGQRVPEAVVERRPGAPALAQKFTRINEVLHRRPGEADLRPFRHPDGTLHLADYSHGLEIDNRPPGVAAVCDFCMDNHGRHVLAIPDFQQYIPEADVVVNNTGGGWMACDTCQALVMAGKKEALLARSVDGSIAKRAQEGRPPVSRGQVVRQIGSIHDEFWLRWTWIHEDPPLITPQSALGIVQSLQKGLAGAVCRDLRGLNLQRLEHARVVLWRSDLWRAAQRGAHAAFTGEAHPYQVLTCEPQFWFFAPRLKDLDTPEMLELAQLPAYSRAMCLFLCPFEGEQGPAIQAGIFYLAPSEDFRRSMVRTGVADPQLLALPCKRSFVPFAAGLTFMGQAFCVLQHHPHPHHLVRKAQKKHRPLPEIHTIQLRRAMEPYGEPHVTSDGPKEAKEWSCSWIAAAHWKQQPHGPRSSLRKQIYVVPKAVRGDPSKPLREPKGVVYVVSR
jgi:hypothetical protein